MLKQALLAFPLLFAPIVSAHAADNTAICYSCPEEWADWGTQLRNVKQELGITVLCNLHQVEYTREFAERIIGMSRGKVVFEGTAADLTEDILHRIYYRDPDEQDGKEHS